MNRDFKVSVLLLLTVLVPSVLRAEEPERLTDEQQAGWKQWADRAGVIRPGAQELEWLKIPWVLDLKAAQATAQAEGRPIFLWVTGDDPLERC